MIFIINFFAISTENNGLERKNKKLFDYFIYLVLLISVEMEDLCLRFFAINYHIRVFLYMSLWSLKNLNMYSFMDVCLFC